MDRLDRIQIFIRVVESGSFSVAARELGVGQPAVSKQVAALETDLGTELIWRTSRTFSLTEAGKDFYESAVRLLEDYEAATAQAGRGQQAAHGMLRVAATPTFARLYVSPYLAEFLSRHPAVTVELITSNSRPHMIEEGADIGLHNGELEDSNLVAKKIAETSVITVASRAYLAEHGTPVDPHALQAHRQLIVLNNGRARDWLFENATDRIIHRPKGRFRSNDTEQIRLAVLSGLGVAQVPAWLFARELATGQVRQVLAEFTQAKSIFAVRPGGRRLTAKVRAFIDFMEEVLARELS
jgi:LysR family transcriptional regulator for bpeEF and oprC